jgi:phosphoribosyl 1,2-cyclic phosphodiesterase
MQFVSLNSGSNGNCYYVGNDHDAVVVDAGLSCRELLRRMQQREVDHQRIRAIFISHEHTDHIKGVDVLSRKLNVPVYITEATHRSARLTLSPALRRSFQHNTSVQINSLLVMPFRKAHDAAEPFSFTIQSSDKVVGVFTDIGYVCNELRHHFSKCHAAFLEANYDDEMLQNGPYPYYLKKRISGNDGHLSNQQALELFIQHRAPHLSHLILSHLSRENNHPDIVYQLFQQHAQDTLIHVASRDEASPVFDLSGNRQTVVQTHLAL